MRLISGDQRHVNYGPRAGGRAVRALGARVAGVLAFALAVAGLGAPAALGAEPEVAATTQWPDTVSADPLPTVQINGVVWTQKVVGNRVFVGGEFTKARPAGAAAGTNETDRLNLLAYNLTTGELETGWNANANGRVMAIDASPDGSRLYIAGGFTSVNGTARYRVAALNTSTGSLITNWSVGTNSVVYDIKATASTVYITGEFSNANNTDRARMAAFSASSGAILPFAPVLDGGYGGRAIEIAPDGNKLVVAGSFTSTNGSTNPGRGMAALDASTAQVLPWAVNSVLRNAGNNSSVYSLASDGDSVYGSGYDFGGSKTEDDWEGAFRANWSDGAMVWMEDCHGDTYSVFPSGGVLYTAAHTHYCGNIGEFPQDDPWYLSHSLAFAKEPSDRTITPDIWGYRSFTGNTAGKMLHWYPRWATGSYTGVGQAGWDVTASGDYLLYGGEFTRVSGVAQQGLVRFAKRSVAPKKMGPYLTGSFYTITARSLVAGQARLTWQANYDPDSAELTYELQRRNVSQVRKTQTVSSTYWVRPLMSYNESGLTPGETYEYRVRVTDPDGNTTVSDWTPVTISTTGSASAYNLKVLDDGASRYWPLNEASGSAGYDWAFGDDITLSSSGVSRVAGPDLTTSSGATSFSGSSNVFGVSTVALQGPQTFSAEAWFKTNTTRGGKILGFGNQRASNSSSYDRHIYLSNDGRVNFGVYPGEVRTITSASGFNDNQWHHVVGTLGPQGMSLYLDGKRVGTRADTTSAQNYSGYWRVGGDSLGSWPNVGSSQFLSGAVSDVAVYDRVLTRDEVNNHWVASGRTSAIPAAPTDSYGRAVYDLDPVLYWRLGESSGTQAKDSGKDGATGTYTGGSRVTLGAAGALAGVFNTAATFTPNRIGSTWQPAYASSDRSYASSTTYAVETWFRTNTTSGGKLVGFGSNRTGTSSNYDRHIYMGTNGQVKFGVWTGAEQVLSTTTAYNDNQWHHVVGTQSAEGMRLYLDGVLVASNSVSTADPYTGYWRIAGDTSWEGDPWWRGTLDEVAVYSQPLSAGQVYQHYTLGKSGVSNNLPTATFDSTVTDLSAAFDASGSSDSDGSIVSYAWDFGDGLQGTGKTLTHDYTSPGIYTVTLVVTDDRGGTGTYSTQVTARAPNVSPTASFTSSANLLDVAFDASASADPDGQIVLYEWDFGDQATGTGRTVTHSYAASGNYEVKLTVTDDRGKAVSTTNTVSVTVPNVAPVAAFGSQVDGLSVAFDGSDSSDSDGQVASYAWDFGDGRSGSGKTVSHAYSEAGTYVVKLTVTDDDNATGSVSHEVTVVVPPAADVVAQDGFGRSVSNAWGTADVGGAWTVTGGAAAFSVADGKGQVVLAPSYTRESRLTGVTGTRAVVDVQIASSVDSVGGTTSVTVIGRQVGSNLYSGRLRFEPNGVLRLYLLRNEVVLGGGSYVLPSTYTAGQAVNVRVSVVGTAPTQLAMKAWVGSSEPSSWQIQASDSTAELQGAGWVGIRHAVSSASTVPSTTLTYDNYKVTKPA